MSLTASFVASLLPPTLSSLSPLLHLGYFSLQLEHRDVAASQTLRAALSKVEAAHPGFSYDLVLGLVRKADASSLNMNESLLRLQGAVSDQDCKFF